MKTRIDLKHQLKTAGLLAALVVSGSAVAQTLPKEGNYDFTSCWSGVSNVIAFSKTHVAFSYEMTGTNRSATPGGFFDKTSFRCVGMNSAFEGKATGTVVCEMIDAQGDKSLMRYINDGTTNTRTSVAGTGKYDGMVSSGTTMPLGPFPFIKPGTFQNCNQQTGTYKLK